MGIIYKLMKYRNLNMDSNKSFNNANIKSDRNRLITIEGNIIEETLQTPTDSPENHLCPKSDSNIDKQFTAEHIIQLCKFLAEKSKRNKNSCKLQQSPKRHIKSKHIQFSFQPTAYRDSGDDVDFHQSEAMPLVSKRKVEQQPKNCTDNENKNYNEFEQQNTAVVLSTRLSPDINSLNISSNTTIGTSCALQHHHQQQHQQQQLTNSNFQYQEQPQLLQSQGKRDILLKIRRQIFERKRLREHGPFEPQVLNNSQVWRPW